MLEVGRGSSALSVDNCKTGLIISFEVVDICAMFVLSKTVMTIIAEHVCEFVRIRGGGGAGGEGGGGLNMKKGISHEDET